MYRSTEIRWFFNREQSHVVDWFAQKGLTYDKIRKRTDHYLNYGQEDIGIKLREGKVEVKNRISEPEVRTIGSQAAGYMESWIKWSFALADADLWSDKIINLEAGKQEWTPVEKWRLGVKRTFNEQGDLVYRKISENVSSACQIEFTRLQINRKLYYTFGIEWYGATFVPFGKSDLDGILGDTVFSIDQSMGYAAFLLMN